MSAEPLAITGIGCVTPVGLSVDATCAALRAGVARMPQFEGWNDDDEQPDPPFPAGRVPLEWMNRTAEEEWPGHERWNLKPPRPHLLIVPDARRLVELAVPAVEEAWAWSGRAGGDTRGVGCYLGLAEGDDGAPIVEAVGQALRVRFEVTREDRLGRAAGLAALHRAARHLREGRVAVALVGAVDSRLRRAAIEQMTNAGVLNTEENPTGVIPGEAAAFLVLEARGSGRRTRLRLAASGVAEEPTAGTDEPCRGEGLTKAIRRTLADAAPPEFRPLVVNDLNGDRYRTLEWGLANVRALGTLRHPQGAPADFEMWHPADRVGDCGAASGGVNVVWALTALRKRYAHTDRALVCGASDGALRAAALLAIEREA
jgi:3-oxoacyl-[acyl-carrier-protein] synthase I